MFMFICDMFHTANFNIISLNSDSEIYISAHGCYLSIAVSIDFIDDLFPDVVRDAASSEDLLQLIHG